jgi:hypothetical protein
MVTAQNVQALLDKGTGYKNEVINLIKKILKQSQAFDETHAVLFNAHSGEAPQFRANNFDFGEEGCEVYISSLWLDEQDNILAGLDDLDGDEYGYGLLLDTAGKVDYNDILAWLKEQL